MERLLEWSVSGWNWANQMSQEDAGLFRSRVGILIEADIAIPAIGQAIDLSFLEEKDGVKTTKRSTIAIQEGTFQQAVLGFSLRRLRDWTGCPRSCRRSREEGC